jgi:ligand-binding SRPBCC domain-containing protein
MKDYFLEREQWIARPLPMVFDFFSRAENLGRITPPWLGFQIRTPTPIHMKVDTRIDYTIRLVGVPMSWRTRITAWEPETRFVDVQERGPYARWEHHHHFVALGEGVRVIDRVRYALPFGPIGRVAHALAVRASLAAIFDYRYENVRELLDGTKRGGADE